MIRFLLVLFLAAGTAFLVHLRRAPKPAPRIPAPAPVEDSASEEFLPPRGPTLPEAELEKVR